MSTIAIILLTPIIILISLGILITMGWPIFYTQQRYGRYKKKFKILKFRTMTYREDEVIPKLTQSDDDRVTALGQILRKWRLDELPQFINVIKGDMSIVGPRPEQAYFANQLEERNPEYNLLFKVRPGITSSGMVEYGYASSIEEMEERLPYDLEYMKKLSLWEDFRIILKTIKVLIRGNGL